MTIPTMYTDVMQPPHVSPCSETTAVVKNPDLNGFHHHHHHHQHSSLSVLSTASSSLSVPCPPSMSSSVGLPSSTTPFTHETNGKSIQPQATNSSQSASLESNVSNLTSMMNGLNVSTLISSGMTAALIKSLAELSGASQSVQNLSKHYFEKVEEERVRLQDELVTYSRFNCVLENINRSLSKGFTALQYVDQNKACSCHEQLNVHLRRIVEEVEIELSVWQRQHQKLLYRFNHRNGQVEASGQHQQPSAFVNQTRAEVSTSSASRGVSPFRMANESNQKQNDVKQDRVGAQLASVSMNCRRENAIGSNAQTSSHKTGETLREGGQLAAASILEMGNGAHPINGKGSEDEENMVDGNKLTPSPPPPLISAAFKILPQDFGGGDFSSNRFQTNLNQRLKRNETSIESIEPERDYLRETRNNSDNKIEKIQSDMQSANDKKRKDEEEKENVKKNEDDKVERFECDWPDCRQTFDSEEILIHHRRCHIRKSNYLCKHCSFRLLSREELEAHLIKCEAASHNASQSSKKRKLEEENSTSITPSSDGEKPKVGDAEERKEDQHSSEEEMEVEELLPPSDGKVKSNPEEKEEEEDAKESKAVKMENGKTQETSPEHRSSLTAEELSYLRFPELLYSPKKRLKSYSISLPTGFLASPESSHHSALSSLYNPLHSFFAGTGAPAGAQPELSSLVDTGRMSPLTFSMLAQQHQQNQQRFQHYLAAQMHQHHNGQAVNNVLSPPVSPEAENLTLPNSSRSSSFGSAASASSFCHRRGSMSGLMCPPSAPLNPSVWVPTSASSPNPTAGRILSSVLSSPQGAVRLTLPSMVTNGFAAPRENNFQRSYTISTPNSFSALAALNAASSPVSKNSLTWSTSTPTSVPSPVGGHLHSSSLFTGLLGPHSTYVPPHGTKQPSSPAYGLAFDGHHHRSNRHSPLNDAPVDIVRPVPTVVSSPSSAPHSQSSLYGQALPPSSGGVQHSQSSMAMIAAAAAAVAGRSHHHPSMLGHFNAASLAMAGGGPGSEIASHFTAAALASLGSSLKPAGPQGPPGVMGEYKRTRYSGIGRYRCPWPDCGYTPHFLRDLRRHMFKHTGDKKHKCDYPDCDFVSVWKTSLLQHQRKKHYGVSGSIPLRSNNHRGNAANRMVNGDRNREEEMANGSALDSHRALN